MEDPDTRYNEKRESFAHSKIGTDATAEAQDVAGMAANFCAKDEAAILVFAHSYFYLLYYGMK